MLHSYSTEELEILCESFRAIVHKIGTANDNNTIKNMTGKDINSIVKRNQDYVKKIEFTKDESDSFVCNMVAESYDLSEDLKDEIKKIKRWVEGKCNGD